MEPLFEDAESGVVMHANTQLRQAYYAISESLPKISRRKY